MSRRRNVMDKWLKMGFFNRILKIHILVNLGHRDKSGTILELEQSPPCTQCSFISALYNVNMSIVKRKFKKKSRKIQATNILVYFLYILYILIHLRRVNSILVAISMRNSVVATLKTP